MTHFALRFSLFVVAAFGGSVLPALAQPGFFSPRDSKAPPQVKRAAEAVYRYVVLDEENPQVLDTDRELARRAARQNPSHSMLDVLVSQALDECKRRGAPSCPVPYMGSGTAFAVGRDCTVLLTARHNLKHDAERFSRSLHPSAKSAPGIGAEIAPALERSEAARKLDIWLGGDEAAWSRSMPLHFVLYDKDAKPVFDTRAVHDYAFVDVSGSKQMLDPRDTFQGDFPADFATIRLSRAVGQVSLELRDSRASVGQRLTVVGYPSATWSRQAFEHAPDSDGFSQYYSMGPVSSTETALHFYFGTGWVADPERDSRIEQSTLYADMEVIPGYSGSPVLDDQGKVVGLMQSMLDVTTAPVEMYMPHRAMMIHSRWILKNLRQYAP